MIKLSPRDLSGSADQDSSWSNPAKISRKVRELAHRSHQAALRADAKPHFSIPRSPEESHQELRDLRSQLARLQQKIHTLGLRGLVPWIDALKRTVDTYQTGPEKEEKR